MKWILMTLRRDVSLFRSGWDSTQNEVSRALRDTSFNLNITSQSAPTLHPWSYW